MGAKKDNATIAYVGGGSRGWARSLIRDLAADGRGGRDQRGVLQ